MHFYTVNVQSWIYFFLEIEEYDYLKCYQEKMTTIFNNFQV